MSTLIDQSLNALKELQATRPPSTESDMKTIQYLSDQFTRIKQENPNIDSEALKQEYNTMLEFLGSCNLASPSPLKDPNTQIPGVPMAKDKLPTNKDLYELEKKDCKPLHSNLTGNSNSNKDTKEVDKPTFDWGIKFTYNPNEQNMGLTCIPNTGTTLQAYEGKQEWFMTLLPAMKSQIPKSPGGDTPNAMPGLQFQLKSNIAKHRIPGSQPIYQHLGVDTVMVTIVGCFTGDGGKKTRIEDVTGPINYANSLNPRMTPQGVRTSPLSEQEQKVVDFANSLAPTPNSPTNYTPGVPLPPSVPNIKRGELLDLLAAKSGLSLDMLSRTVQTIEQKGYVWRLNKFISPEASINEVNTYIYDSNYKYYDQGEIKNPLLKSTNSNVGQIQGESLTSKTRLQNEGVNTTWMSNINMSGCESQVCQPAVEQHERLDSYHEFTSFQRLSYNRELEIEINLAKNNDGRAPKQNKYEVWGWDATAARTQKDADWGPLRNGKNGNPCFKGVIRGMEAYYARQDRTWYLMTIEITDLGLSSDIPLNLIKELTEAAEAAAEDVKDETGVNKDLKDPDKRLDCILQQGNGQFTEPDDVKGTTNRAYVSGNALMQGELLGWDTYTGEGIKYKIETTKEGGKDIKYAKATSEVLSPHDVGMLLANTSVDADSAISGGVWGIRVDTNVRKKFFLTLYERGAIDYKPSNIGEDVLQSEVVSDIQSGNNDRAEKSLQELCRRFYTSNRKFEAGTTVDGGAKTFTNDYRMLTSMTLGEAASKVNTGVSESELGVLVNEWTNSSEFTKDKGVKLFQDLRMISQGTCKGFALARANVPGAEWKLITPYGLFKQLLEEANQNTEADLKFLLDYIDIKTNPYQSGYVAFVDGTGSKDPSLKNLPQQIACFDDTRVDMDSTVPGIQGIRDVNGGQYNQYDPLAAGDSIPLDGLDVIDSIIGVANVIVQCGVNLIPVLASAAATIAGFAAGGVPGILGLAVTIIILVLSVYACIDSIAQLLSAAVGKTEYDRASAVADMTLTLAVPLLGSAPVRNVLKKIASALGDVPLIKKVGKEVIDQFTKIYANKQLMVNNPLAFVKKIWGDFWDALDKYIPDLRPFIDNIKNGFEDIWIAYQNFMNKMQKKPLIRTRAHNNATDVLTDFSYADPDLLAHLAKRTDLTKYSASNIPPVGTKLVQSGKTQVFEVVGIRKSANGNVLRVKLKDTLGNEYFVDPADLDKYLNAEELAKKSSQIKADMAAEKRAAARNPSPSPTPVPTTPTPSTTPAPVSPTVPGTPPTGNTPSFNSLTPPTGSSAAQLTEHQRFLDRLNKLTTNDPNIITQLANENVVPLSATNIPARNDLLVKVGDTRAFKVIGTTTDASGNVTEVVIKGSDDSIEQVPISNLDQFFNSKDLYNPNVPATGYTPPTQNMNPANQTIVTAAPPNAQTAQRALPPARTASTPTVPVVRAPLGDTNNYVNTAINGMGWGDTVNVPPQTVFKAYDETATFFSSKTGTFVNKPIIPNSLTSNIGSIDSMLRGHQYINAQGKVLTYQGFDVQNEIITFVDDGGQTITYSLDNTTDKLYNISVPLTNIELNVFKTELNNAVLNP